MNKEQFVAVIADSFGQATPTWSYPAFAMLFGSLVVAFFLAVRCDAVERFPNARYLGMGYNLITGNPDDNLLDPGFAFSVLEFT